MSRSDMLGKLFWKEPTVLHLEKCGNFYVDPGNSAYGFCPKCEAPTEFVGGIAFCGKCGTKIVKSGLVA